ncbi:MAG: 3-keto-5-aminohexanoate cleavage protein [Actinomycetota bacterium]|nr:3-keto-5-aminohexanoate cleavage protein [Actinomycetota bacterium]
MRVWFGFWNGGREVVLQSSLNGTRPADAHPALPISPLALAQDAHAVYALGVRSVHVHPRCSAGLETIDTHHVGDAVAAIRSAVPAMEIGVPSCRWVQPCPTQRMQTVAAWGQLGQGKPDVVAVNVHEDGWVEICARACEQGIGLELGVWTPGDAVRLRQAGLPPGVVRVVAEVTVADPQIAVAEAARILRALGPMSVPVLLHGEENSTWAVLEYATAHGYDTRIGLEDVLTNPDGSVTGGNADLARHAQGIRARGGPRAGAYEHHRLASSR